jgi:hypothetical protein
LQVAVFITWRKALVNSSLDGASVNLGQHRGVGKLLGDAAPMQVTLHAAAHIVQLCVSDVLGLCEYHVLFKELVAKLGLPRASNAGSEVPAQLEVAVWVPQPELGGRGGGGDGGIYKEPIESRLVT